MFVAESLVVNRSERWLRWSLRTLLSRRIKTLRFDDLRHVTVDRHADDDPVEPMLVTFSATLWAIAAGKIELGGVG